RKLLPILLIILSSFQFDRSVPADAFTPETLRLLSEVNDGYTESNVRFTNGKYNDYVLETDTTVAEKRIVTLRGRDTIINRYGKRSHQKFFISLFRFDDSSQCEASFKTLLNCLGTDCAKVSWNDSNVHALKSPPFIYFKMESEIVCCKIQCEHENKAWQDLKSIWTEVLKD